MKGHLPYLILTAVALLIVWTKASPRWRTVVLLGSVLALGFGRLELPSVHCIVEGFFDGMNMAFLKTPMILKLAVAFIPAVLFGRVFCGYVCPKGAVQELVFVRRLRLRHRPRLDRALRTLPYLSLGALVYFPLAHDYRAWTDLDPFLWAFQGHGHLPGLILLALLLPLSLVMSRPFCRYLCPLAPIFRLLTRLAPNRRTRDDSTCRPCHIGRRSCDYDVITLTKADQGKACAFHPTECLECNACRLKCPRESIR